LLRTGRVPSRSGSSDRSMSHCAYQEAQSSSAPSTIRKTLWHVSNQEPFPAAGILQVHHKVVGGLRRPRCRRVGGGAQDLDSQAGVLDHPNTCSRAPARVTVSKKAQASRASAWERRKSAHVVELRSGAGSIRRRAGSLRRWKRRLLIPDTSSSPCTRILADQSQHQDANRPHGARSARAAGRDRWACRRATTSRCQRSTVSGSTIKRSLLCVADRYIVFPLWRSVRPPPPAPAAWSPTTYRSA
jgi:hypothetical protein